jgi:hypothetical protein
LPQAFALAAIATGAGDVAIGELREFGAALTSESFDANQQRLESLSINDQAKSKLEELAAYFSRGRRA